MIPPKNIENNIAEKLTVTRKKTLWILSAFLLSARQIIA
jgi:hypothetical protein